MNIRIKDICRFGKKSDIKAGEGNTKGKYMFFTSSIDKDKRIDKFDYDEEGIIMGTGGNATLHYYSGKFAVSTDCLVLLPNSSYKCKYLYYFFLHNMRVLEGGFRGAGLKHTSKSYIENIELTKTHSLLEQDKIISVLSNIDNTIVLQNKRLKLINELTRSLFIEMFGDPINNSKNLPTTKLIDVVMLQRGYDLPINERAHDGNIPVFGSNGILGYHNKSKVVGGGVITGRSGSIGSVYYTKEDYWPLNTSLFSVKLNGNNIVFIAYLLKFFDLSRFADGTGVPTLNRNIIHDKQIINVIQSEQNRFAEYVSSIDKSKYSSFSHLSA
mgnify:CR=1 FL=1